jgi:hypothetical protein
MRASAFAATVLGEGAGAGSARTLGCVWQAATSVSAEQSARVPCSLPM